MNWYRIQVQDGTAHGHTFAGSSPDSLDQLIQKAMRGEYLRLDNLVYWDQGQVKDWAEWDRRDAPTVCINPAHVLSIQPFKGDPRTLPR